MSLYFVKERELEMNKYNYKIEKITFTNLCLNNKFKLIHKLAFYLIFINVFMKIGKSDSLKLTF